jgi:glycosyltransferase involved in cell wall biosynthesis
MSPHRLDVLFVTLFPTSPPTFGAQRRIEGLMKALARRHRVTAVSLLGAEFDGAVAERAMREYCDEVVLVPKPSDRGAHKRFLQLRSLASWKSYEHHSVALPQMQRAIDRVLRRRRHHVVMVEAPWFMQYRFRQAPRGAPPPLVIHDEHNIEHDLARRLRDASESLPRRLHYAVNWRKLRREEIAGWRAADGVAFTSPEDAERARALYPAIRSSVIPNGVDVDHFQASGDARADARSAVFFGTMDYFPNLDGVRYLLGDIWPRLTAHVPGACLQVIGPHPSPEVLAQRGPRVEVTGCVPDLRPYLARAGVVVVPLRVGGGTRFKILEAMAMSRPVVSTTIGAEGIGATDGRNILIADGAEAFAAAVRRVMEDPDLARRIGAEGRALVERHYSWTAVGAQLERFIGDFLGHAPAPVFEVAATSG